MKKKLLLLTVILTCCLKNVYTQEVYVIFTSTNSETKGAWNFSLEKTSEDFDTPRVFTLFDRAGGNKKLSYIYRFWYKARVNIPANHFRVLDLKSLKSLNVIDWDLIKHIDEAKLKYKNIISYEKIYFIDRNETTSSYKVYPVELFRLNYR